jgi:hypothetical protein
MSAEAKSRKQRRRGRRRRILGSLLVLCMIFIGGAAWVWSRARLAPTWYVPPDPADEQVAELAERVEYGVVEEFHRIREEPEPWTVRFREQQLNAWLAARMPEWIAHEQNFAWPEELGTPQIHVDGEHVNVAIEVRTNGSSRVVTARVTPEIVGDRLHIRLDRVGLGRVAMPGEPAERLVKLVEEISPNTVLSDAATKRVFDILSGREPLDAIVELSDGRRVELVGFRIENGIVDVTSRTLPAE